ncbi:DHS-like NAD/FAD-binding domain-containing protein [Bombardia bombarda]|uniref:DHS-like NAD/FAD-binding domain-containing protein n=1 Tax=Bombardia bombarda TaxID=252184 RepID=A0AA39XN99_9PEZI|nr:DHS-like NAD/FAD-binding domain-containing protein [Bombardia bombarda]
MPRRHALTRLTHVRPGSQELQTIADAFSGARKIVTIAGAGISTAAGIPDFRSSGGLYANGALFEEAAFFDSRRPLLFQTALHVRDLAAACQPTETHRWLASLRPKLLRCYTQNVDMLEAKAGLATGLGRRFDCIPLHGSLANLKCHLCHEAYEWEDYRRDIQDCNIDSNIEDDKSEDDEEESTLPCPRCNGRYEARKEAGMRLLPIGQLRPSMVMLDETHPHGEEIAHLARGDGLASPDLLLVLGTSLKVDGPKSLFRQFARRIRGQGGKIVYVNRTKPPSDCSALVDYWVQWDVDEWVRDLKGRQDQSGTGMRRGSARRASRRDRILPPKTHTLPAFGNIGAPQEPLGSRGNPIPLD